MYHSYIELTLSFLEFIFSMAHINDHLVSLSSDYGSSGSTPFVRTETSASSVSSLSVTSHFAPVITSLPDSFESEEYSYNSHDRETSLDGSYFDTLLSDDDVISGRVVIFMLVSSIVVKDSTLPILASL